ncbi:MAG: hypothetical protein FWB72_05075 [Firmicutes bacterium]|nr:hypothetical protein [Bacillota bacterium]
MNNQRKNKHEIIALDAFKIYIDSEKNELSARSAWHKALDGKKSKGCARLAFLGLLGYSNGVNAAYAIKVFKLLIADPNYSRGLPLWREATKNFDNPEVSHNGQMDVAFALFHNSKAKEYICNKRSI